MNKFKKIYIVIPIIFILGIVITFKTISYFNTPKYSVKGLISDENNNLSKMIDLGSYKEENEIYNKYPGYILTNNSNFNILRILGIEVKYPSILKQYPSLVKDRSIQIENEDNTLQLRIQNIKNTDGETVQEWLKNTEVMDKALSKNTDNIQSEVKENKIIRRYSSKDNSRGFIDINIVNKDNIKCLFVSYLKGIENEEMIIKTIEKSFILKDS